MKKLVQVACLVALSSLSMIAVAAAPTYSVRIINQSAPDAMISYTTCSLDVPGDCNRGLLPKIVPVGKLTTLNVTAKEGDKDFVIFSAQSSKARGAYYQGDCSLPLANPNSRDADYILLLNQVGNFIYCQNEVFGH